tara:strand:+ start:161 stop:613 length:453 start_codon:yes stop_codon:yes gene_type:complete
MSTVVLDTITGKSTATTITIGSTPVVSASANSMTIRGEGSAQTSIQQGLGKSWCHLDLKTENSIDDSFNTANITDSATGRFLVTNTSAMASINYTITANTWNGNDNQYGRMISPDLARTTTIAKLAGTDSTNRTLEDFQDVDVLIHGDLA